MLNVICGQPKPVRQDALPKLQLHKKLERHKSLVKLAQSLAMHQLMYGMRFFNKKLPVRLLQSKLISSAKLKSKKERECVLLGEDCKKQRSKAEAHVQFGHTVITLREFFPAVLLNEWPEEILAEDVVFVDGVSPRFNLLPFNANGKEAYMSLMWQIRFLAHLFCKQTKVEILRFWQPCKETLIIRWSMRFRPRLLYDIYGTTLQVDGVSEFKLNSKGKIYEHCVDISDHHNFKFDLNFQRFLQKRELSRSSIGI